MAVYKFRVTFEEHDEISRDIEIKSVQNFDDLHNAIQEAINFDSKHSASFYMSDDYWKKGQEISNKKSSNKGDKVVLPMKKSRLCDFIIDPHQKILYDFDFERPDATGWTFFIELVKILQDEKSAKYPRCVKKVNDAPKQYGVTVLGKVYDDDEGGNHIPLVADEDDIEHLGEDNAEPSESQISLEGQLRAYQAAGRLWKSLF